MFYCCYGVRPCLCGTAATNGPIIYPAGDHELIRSRHGMLLTGETEGLGKKPVRVCYFVNHNPTSTTLGAKPGLRDENPVTNLLSCDTVLFLLYSTFLQRDPPHSPSTK